MKAKYANLSTSAMQSWLRNHQSAIALGLNVGQLDRDKAQAFRIELIHRNG